MKKRRKIYYVPGMISLIFLPLICCLYLNKFHKKEERSIELSMPARYDPKLDHKNKIVFDTTCLSWPENRRNYTIIDIDNSAKNQKNLKLFNDRVLQIIKTNDTVNAIHLLFGKESTYGQFIEALNICNKDTFPCYIVLDDNLWFLHKNYSQQIKNKILTRRKESIERQNESERYITLNRILKKPIESKDESNLKILKDMMKVWPCFILIAILGFISIRSVNRKK
jgi:hypothetical protein